jgi:hypothetical protein
MSHDIRCPKCGEDVSDSPCEDFNEEGDYETECGKCEAPVLVSVFVSVDYRVRLLEEK